MPFVTVCNSNKLKSSAVQQNMDRRSSLYYAAKFQNYNSVGVSSVEDELKTLKYNSSLDERDPGEGCGNNFVVDWTNDQSILQRKNQVSLFIQVVPLFKNGLIFLLTDICRLTSLVLGKVCELNNDPPPTPPQGSKQAKCSIYVQIC